MAFDGIVTKAIASELQQISGARIDKIFQPNKNILLLGFYLDGTNYLLNICTDPINYRINLTTNTKKNPQIAPNFCMVLRKHLIGLRIKNVITNNLERIVTIEFEGFDDIDDIISRKLIIELMGKHCNVILLDEQNIIIDSLRHINSENSSRTIVPHVTYVFPSISKSNFLDCSLKDFINTIETSSIENLISSIANFYNGISNSFIENSLRKLNITEINQDSIKKIYFYIKEIINCTDSLNLNFELSKNENNVSYDYFLVTKSNHKISDKNDFSLNFFLDDFYYQKESNEEFKSYRNSILKMILATLKKYQKRLLNINEKLKNCDNMDIYKLYGELITANLYKIKDQNIESIELENYYDNNKKIVIPLDCKYSPSINAKRYFKKYNKLKNALSIVTAQKEETEKELNYIESIVYELETAKTVDEIADIYEEISENVIFKDVSNNLNLNNTIKSKSKIKNNKIKKSQLTKNKNVSFNPLKYIIDGYTLLVGRNNNENDYLSLKYAKKTDLWFHTKDIHGSHAVLILDSNVSNKVSNKIPTNDVIIKCAEIVAYHSKARNSSNVPVDVCEIKYVKKPKGSKPGMVIYTNYQTFNVNPKIYNK